MLNSLISMEKIMIGQKVNIVVGGATFSSPGWCFQATAQHLIDPTATLMTSCCDPDQLVTYNSQAFNKPNQMS